MRLQAVLFDLWGTLILDPPERSLPRQTWRAHEVHRVLRDHGFRVELEPVLDALIKTSSALGALQDQGTDLKAGGRAALFANVIEQAAGLRVPGPALPGVEEAIGFMPEQFQPLPEPHANQTLAAVKASGLATALVSNAGLTTAPNLRRILRDYYFLPHFDYLVFSDELGCAKPDRRIFQEALDGLNLSPDVCAYVGDSPHNDIGGAQALGMFAVQIGTRTRDGITPQERISSLDQLMPALRTHLGVTNSAVS